MMAVANIINYQFSCKFKSQNRESQLHPYSTNLRSRLKHDIITKDSQTLPSCGCLDCYCEEVSQLQGQGHEPFRLSICFPVHKAQAQLCIDSFGRCRASRATLWCPSGVPSMPGIDQNTKGHRPSGGPLCCTPKYLQTRICWTTQALIA